MLQVAECPAVWAVWAAEWASKNKSKIKPQRSKVKAKKRITPNIINKIDMRTADIPCKIDGLPINVPLVGSFLYHKPIIPKLI